MAEVRRFYDTAEICKNGHVITIHYESQPVERKNYCPQCNAATIHECPNCKKKIQGCYHSENHEALSCSPLTNSSKYYSFTTCLTKKDQYTPPAYCHNCGSPFPWTEALIAEADKIIEMMSELTPAEKEELKLIFPDLIAETSSTISSSIKFEKLLKPVNALLISALQAATGNFIVAAATKFLGW
jgi:Uncharacterized protein conserved in bacteria